MEKIIKLVEKYERNGWPSIARPDLKPPEGWSISLATSIQRIRNHSLSPDGKAIAFIQDSETFSDVHLMPLAGGWPARISTERELVPYWNDEIPQWSPDSKWVAFSMLSHVYVVPADGGIPKKVTDFAGSASSPKWMPNSKGLVVSVERGDTDQLLLTDREGAWPRPLTTDTQGDHWDPQPSPDGRSVSFVYRRFDDLNRLDICLVDVNSSELCLVRGLPAVRMWMPRWSPNGEWIAFISQEAGNDHLWVARPDGRDARQVTKENYAIGDISWSPDGRQIAATLNRDASFELVLVDAVSGEITPLHTVAGVCQRPCWTPDGDTLTFEFETPIQTADLYSMDLATRQVRQLTFSQPLALPPQKMIMPERVSYKGHDGLEIPALLFKPVRPNGAAILHPHGGPSSQYVFDFDILAQFLVAKGYTFLAPNYRGSTGYGVDFEHLDYGDWGQGDTKDCLQGAKYLQSLEWVDPKRLAIMGGSYGGYLTICALARDPEYLFACGVAKYGDSNLVSSWAQCSRELRLYTEVFLKHPAREREAYMAGSPITEARNVQKPMLILHGLLDDIVPPESSEEWVEALKRENKVFEYKTYDDEPHGFLRRENLIDVFERVERFLDWYLLPR